MKEVLQGKTKAVLLGSEPMENKPEETLLIPHEKLSIFYEWLENHDKQVRSKAIDEYKKRVWEDIETRYKSDIKILGYLSAEKLLKDVHTSICYFAEQLKEQTNGV